MDGAPLRCIKTTNSAKAATVVGPRRGYGLAPSLSYGSARDLEEGDEVVFQRSMGWSFVGLWRFCKVFARFFARFLVVFRVIFIEWNFLKGLFYFLFFRGFLSKYKFWRPSLTLLFGGYNLPERWKEICLASCTKLGPLVVKLPSLGDVLCKKYQKMFEPPEGAIMMSTGPDVQRAKATA